MNLRNSRSFHGHLNSPVRTNSAPWNQKPHVPVSVSHRVLVREDVSPEGVWVCSHVDTMCAWLHGPTCMTSSLYEVWPCMYGISNGTLEADQASNVPALGRDKSCVCHVCAGPARTRYTHIWPHGCSAQRFPFLMRTTCVCLRYMVITLGLLITHTVKAARHLLLPRCQGICLLFHSSSVSLPDCQSTCRTDENSLNPKFRKGQIKDLMLSFITRWPS